MQIKPDGKTIYFGGQKVQHVPNEGKNTNISNLKTTLGMKFLWDMPIRDIRIYEDGKIIIHHAISNNLTIYNIDLTVFKEFLGVKEKYNSRIELPQLRRKKQSASDALETIEDSYGTRVVAISPSLINLLVKSSTMKAFGSKKIKKTN